MQRPSQDIILRIGTFRVDPAAHRISSAKGTVKVEPKPMQVLACLAEHAGQTVPRDYLMDTIWPDVCVDDNALRRSISQLRKAFDDDPRQPDYIETIPRVGYRLIASVTPVAANERFSTPKKRGGEDVAASGAKLVDKEVVAWKMGSRVLQAVGRVLFRGVALLVIFTVFSSGVYVFNQVLLRPSASRGSPLSSMDLPGQESYPAFSPDGKEMVFAWKAQAHEDTDLYIKDLASGKLVRLTDHAASEWMPGWTADGQHIVFARSGKEADCGIFLVAAQGGFERRLTGCGASQHGYALAPDEARIVVSEKADPEASYALVEMDLATQERNTLTQPPAFYHDVFPVFSPDGRHLAFVRNQSPTIGDLYVMDSNGGGANRITFDNAGILGFSWTPDGQSLLFASNRTGPYALWRVPWAGGTPTLHTTTETHVPTFPTVNAEGDQLAYVACSIETNIWRVPITSDAGFWQGLMGPVPVGATISASSKKEYHPHLSRDGRQMAFVSNRSGHSEIWVSTPDAPEPTRLTQLESGYAASPRWSPDGQELVFSLHREGKTNLFLIDAQSKTMRALTDTPVQNVLPSWSADGERIYFASNRSGAWEVWMVPVAGGAAQRMTAAGGYHVHEVQHSATSYLYYTKRGKAGLWRKRLDGESEEKVLDQPAPRDEMNWAPAAQGLYFVQRQDTDPVLAFYDIGTQRTTVFKTELADLSVYHAGLTVSPDGRWVYYARDDHKASGIVQMPFSP